MKAIRLLTGGFFLMFIKVTCKKKQPAFTGCIYIIEGYVGI